MGCWMVGEGVVVSEQRRARNAAVSKGYCNRPDVKNSPSSTEKRGNLCPRLVPFLIKLLFK